MAVLLGVGTPFSNLTFAINDFESIPVGTVLDLTIGLLKQGGANWGATIIFSRR